MKKEGQIVLFRFPNTDYTEAKLRPAVLIKKVPGEHNDWLIFRLIRIARIALVQSDVLTGAIGEIAKERLSRIKTKLANWIQE